MERVKKAIMKATKNRKNGGFTLIEMIIVIAIIAILIALIAPNMMKFLDTADQTKTDAAAKTLYTSAQTYVTAQFVAGSPVSAGTYSKGQLTNMEKDYFNSDELSQITAYTVQISGKVVTKVTLDMGDKKGQYPKKATVSGN